MLREGQAMDPAWRFEYSVTCAVPVELAWEFWTDVRNWSLDADVEAVTLDGPFAAGARGRTISRSSGVIQWRIADVQQGSCFRFPSTGRERQFCVDFQRVFGWYNDPPGGKPLGSRGAEVCRRIWPRSRGRHPSGDAQVKRGNRSSTFRLRAEHRCSMKKPRRTVAFSLLFRKLLGGNWLDGGEAPAIAVIGELHATRHFSEERIV